MPIFNSVYKWYPQPWVYHNAWLWLISLSSDGDTRITIADKNLWATTVYNDGDTLSEANCWKFYQRWNNYWFAFTWPTTTSSTQVNTNNYWPWNYYSSSTFITTPNASTNWSSVNNANLRWWTDWTNIAMKWPCNTWFHVPLSSEWNSVRTFFLNNGGTKNMLKHLKAPSAWRILYNWTVQTSINEWVYWASNEQNNYQANCIYSNASGTTFTTYVNKSNWYNIRPFANMPTRPDSTRAILYKPS